MMATPTTQIIWRKVTELAKQRLSKKYEINASPSKFKGETLPVESVSFENVQIWIKALNELSEVGEPDFIDIIAGHKKGDVYRY